jgi:hypothetical protein
MQTRKYFDCDLHCGYTEWKIWNGKEVFMPFRRLGLLLIILIIAACTTTMTTRTVTQPITDGMEMRMFLDAVTATLVQNGFDIKMLNESFGLVSTEWRPVKSGADTAATVLSALGSGPMTSYSRGMMIQFQKTDLGYIVTPKLKRMAQSQSLFGTTQENVDYPTRESGEGKLVEKIIQEVNTLLGLDNTYYWEEKIIEIVPE